MLRKAFRLKNSSLMIGVHFLYRYRIAYVIFYFLGMTTLMPWNFFITADDVSLNRSYTSKI